MTKYALIVDPFSSGALYANVLVSSGLTPVAIISHDPILDIYSGSFKKEDYPHIFLFKGNLQELIEDLEGLLNNEKPILILPGTESGVELADSLSSYFIPDLTNGTQLSASRRNKFEMAKQLSSTKLPLPLTIRSSATDEVLQWAREEKLLPTGVVIKPLNSAGTDGVTACFTEAEIMSAMSKNLGKINQMNITNEQILAQEFLAGIEHVVDTVSVHGKHIVTDICRYKKTAANGSNFVYEYLEFLPPEGLIQSELSEYAYKVLDGLGIQTGPAHSEIMYTAKGPRLIETGVRPHGGIAIHACRMATGSSQVDLTVSSILNPMDIRENKIGFKLENHTRIVFLISYFDDLVLNESENISKIKLLPSFKMMKTNVKPGEALKKTIDLFTMPGLLILSHPSAEQIEADYAAIRQFEKEGLFVCSSENTQKKIYEENKLHLTSIFSKNSKEIIENMGNNENAKNDAHYPSTGLVSKN